MFILAANLQDTSGFRTLGLFGVCPEYVLENVKAENYTCVWFLVLAEQRHRSGFGRMTS